MKKILAFLMMDLLIFGVVACFAQGHTATLTWTAPPDAVATSTYNVYRASGACPVAPAVPTWTLLTTTPVNTLTFQDTSITVGSWCYAVTQVQAGVESAKSTPAGGTAAPNTVTFTVVIQ